MSFEGIVQIQNEDSPVDVNKKLTEGWELLAVNPSNDGLIYTIGRRAKSQAPVVGRQLQAAQTDVRDGLGD
ncbi:hypothetical protein [Pseudomonas brassicacearum]|uniref:hypothetical protein n=1 Tax=Pseudomonas brassicacearum TaxID=930166 RepID=UPI0005796E54|nr:hypothetical protein [Pseudomonas brassicacearum]